MFARKPRDLSKCPVTFQTVFADELEQIKKSRAARNPDARTPPKTSLVGLAFSGGGIRSATFNLGVMQALAENHLLHKFDYLSTVSGGGYIGSWLAALTRRFTETFPGSTFADVEQALVPARYEHDKRNEPTFLHWLRLYSNYLTPNRGPISGDTWAMVGTWLRNVFLNLLILSLIFVGGFVFCHGVLLFLVRTEDAAERFIQIGAAFLFFAAICMAVNVVDRKTVEGGLKNWFQRIKVSATVMAPFVVACLLLNWGLWRWLDLSKSPLWKWAAAGAAFYAAIWVPVAVLVLCTRLKKRQQDKPQQKMISVWYLLIFSPVAGAAGACLLKAYNLLLSHLPPWILTSTNWVVVVFGSGIVMLVLLITGAVHIGLVGQGSRDLVREWWARLGGYLFLVTVAWLLLAGTCVFGPLLIRLVIFKVSGWKSIFAALLWIANSYLGVKAAYSPKTSGENEKPIKSAPETSNSAESVETARAAKSAKFLVSPKVLEVVAKIAPYIFAAGLILLFSTAVHVGVGSYFDASDTTCLWLGEAPKTAYWHDLSERYWAIQESARSSHLLSAGLILALVGIALSWRVDVNDFSLHHFYRNRLVRCYLGASNPQRSPQAFTGFDPNDDLPLADLAEHYVGPYPILNTALNITSGEELGYATRRAKSFIFTPRYCGYDLRTPGDGEQRFKFDDGYLPAFSQTVDGRSQEPLASAGCERGIQLGTAMAISGAAASPNMGYFTSSATAFFMTLFDVRLGWWIGNPRRKEKWRKAGPALGIAYLLSELLAQSDQNRSYVYLSDGGHFENLAVYELIKRHCKVIVACDADCDPNYGFDNLISLIEKARTDFGARVDIDVARIRPKSGRESDCNFVTGPIYYDPKDDDDQGTLIYLKTSMPQRRKEPRLPDDVWRYFDLHRTFPHQTTADQWFDEQQFESYRALGEYIGKAAADEIRRSVRHVL